MIACNQKNWELTTDVQRLSAIQPVKIGPRHEPVNHGEALQLFKSVAGTGGVQFGKEFGMLSKDGARYVYVADVTGESTLGDLAFTLGFVNYNNMRKAFCGLAGERVFVCSNQRFSGVMEDSTKHLNSLKAGLTEKMQGIVGAYEKFREKRLKEIDTLKSAKYDDASVGRATLAFLREGVFAGATVQDVVREWDRPSYPEFQDRTAWSFLNACTHVMKKLESPMRVADISSKLSDIVMRAK